MNRGVLCAIIFICLPCLQLSAQKLDTALYNTNNRLIKHYLNAANYELAAKTVSSQIQYIEFVNAHDSLFRYVYKLGKSYSKSSGADVGLSKGENLLRLVKMLDKDTSHVLQAINDMSWLYFETGNAVKCYESDKSYLELCKAYKNVTPIQLFTAYYSLGYDYLDFGNTNEAISHITQALKILPENDTLYTDKLINGYNLLGSITWRKGDLKGAKQAFEKSLEYIKQLKDPYIIYSNRSNTYGNLGILAQDDGDLILSKDLNLLALEDRKKATNLCTDPKDLQEHKQLMLVGYRNLASLYLALGDMTRSLQIVNYIKSEQEKLMEPNDPKLGLNYEGLGAIYIGMDDAENALKNFGIYRDMCEKNFGKASFHTALSHKRIGEVYLEQNRLDEAIISFNHARDCILAADANNQSNELASIYHFRADAHQKKGDFEMAAADMLQAIEIYKNTRNEINPKLGNSYAKLADFYLEGNQTVLAMQAADQAIEVLVTYQNKIREDKDFELNNLVQFLPNAYYIKAKIYHQTAKSEEDRISANNFMDKSLKLLRENKNTVESEDAKIMLYQHHQHIFDFAQEMCYAHYESSKDERHLTRMFELAEENKTILLRKQLNNFSSLKFHNIPDSIQERERYLNSVISGKITPPDSTYNPVQYQHEYEALLRHIEIEYPEYYQLRFQDQTISIDKIKSELLKDEYSLIQYIKTDEHLYAMVFTPNKNHLIKMEAENVNELVKNYVKAIKQPYIEPFVQAASALYSEVFSQVDSLITTTNLYIIPDADLFSINFETLVKTQDSNSPQYLIYDYNISYLLSATTAIQSNQLNRDRSGKLLAIAPGFSDELKREYLSYQQDSILMDQLYLNCLQQPFAVQSATNVAGIFSGKVFTGKDATENQFKKNAAEFGIIHFGTHTEINNTSPMLSRLILTKNYEESELKEDGYLHAYEIYNLPLRAELAVLTACETGVGKRQISEGVLSIAHSFAYAGCPSVIMSLWQIDEKTSAGIIEDFYNNLSDEMPKSDALRLAKLNYLKKAKNELAAPYFWAGMVLVGNTDPIEKTSHNFWWWLVPVILIILILAVIRNRKVNGLSKAQ